MNWQVCLLGEARLGLRTGNRMREENDDLSRRIAKLEQNYALPSRLAMADDELFDQARCGGSSQSCMLTVNMNMKMRMERLLAQTQDKPTRAVLAQDSQVQGNSGLAPRTACSGGHSVLCAGVPCCPRKNGGS